MDENKVLQMLKESAEEVTVPENLEADRIEERLRNRKKEQKMFRFRKLGHYAALAAVCMLVISGVWTLGRMGIGTKDMKKAEDAKQTSDGASGGMQEEKSEDTAESTAVLEGKGAYAVSNGLNPYRQAKDYGAVYDAVQREYDAWAEHDGTDKGMERIEDTAKGEPLESTGSEGGYTETNVQTEGVAEGDFVKTDGKYLYVVSGGEVQIVDIRSGKPNLVGKLKPRGLQKGGSREIKGIYEIYVENDLLQIVCSNQEVELVCDDTLGGYEVEQKHKVYLYTYDISDRTKPELLGVVEQDGYYQSSRKREGYVYLFTSQRISAPSKRDQAIQEDGVGEWLPWVNRKVFEAEDIWIAEGGGTDAYLVSSVMDDNPGVIQDSKMLIAGNVTEYVSEHSIYLYEEKYDDEIVTSIAKFDYDCGKITAGGGAIVDGSIRDTFAVNEKDGYLRVLTTVYEEQWENQVYVLDETMDICGKVEGLAPGEEIYAARFLGDYGYFVTYRNTDPLFSVDFSDPEEPKIVGELKITGFSDYLHFWSENQLLGIGYETDEVTGQQMGVKLSMFDITDPGNVLEENKAVLSKVYDTPATYEYKTVLVDQQENMIGFLAKGSGAEGRSYLIYAYSEEQGFQRIFRADADEFSMRDEAIRGIYAGDIFYLVSDRKVAAYDRKNAYEEVGRIDFD